MSRRSLRTGEGESVTSWLPGQDATSRSRWEMEAASSVCSRLCYCGNVVKTHTSWTVSHPGRRFQVCARRNGCTFWEWADPEMCDRSKHIIPGLLRKINRLEEEQNVGKGKMKNPWFWVSVFLVGMVIYLLFSKCNRTPGHLQLAG
ncbi:hypothetical protein L3X38_017711 [Prunus dulcis]|uniref:GRF-type domain-containing protein n=1 Tax=Prunus dulcis TaxID=3755 RepID=A0AAD4ZA17_PRUDU|nr:hypothetical protein L3X38_017711 [Prunus dulcis]